MRNSKELLEFIHVSGQTKRSLRFSRLFALSILAGVYISFGAIFFTTVSAYGGNPGMIKLLSGLVFSTGLVLVAVAGAELFTGNNLLIIPLMNKKITFADLFRNWGIVYLGNLIGSLLMVVFMFGTGIYSDGNGEIGQRALEISIGKVSLDFISIFFRGILCNMLVCLAIWLTMVAKTVPGKVLGVLFPITAFVAIGFEHSVANMYFVPAGMIIKSLGSENFWSIIAMDSSSFDMLNLQSFLFNNLIPVTLGNIVGGSLFIGMIFWFVHKDELRSF